MKNVGGSVSASAFFASLSHHSASRASHRGSWSGLRITPNGGQEVVTERSRSTLRELAAQAEARTQKCRAV